MPAYVHALETMYVSAMMRETKSAPAPRQRPGAWLREFELPAQRQRIPATVCQPSSPKLSPGASDNQEEPMTSITPKCPSDAIPDDLILAAIDRAERHRGDDVSRVPIWEITAHLDIGRRSTAARHVRSRIAALESTGRLARSRSHGVPVWSLTPSGRQRLRRADRAANVPALPESPQHRKWHDARALAALEIERLRNVVRSAIDETAALLDGRPVASSDVWFELSERLRRTVWCLGSATYCLHEWAEPSDDVADIDDGSDPGDQQLVDDERARRRGHRAGRRNVTLWRDR